MRREVELRRDLYTPEGEMLASLPDSYVPWNTYPRPHLRRDSFLCLNGWWDFAITDGREPREYSEHIRVPFVPESVLSGIGQSLPEGARLYYRRHFGLPDDFVGERVLLHMGACDQIAEIILNGKRLGEHRGGYDSFSFDVTDLLQTDNVLQIRVTDEQDGGILPYGKQCRKRGGMWYTPVSGIWQTVWLEAVPQHYVRELTVQTDGAVAQITVDWSEDSIPTGEVILHRAEGDVSVPLENGRATLTVRQPKLWSPEDPHLYNFTVRVGQDLVTSYFALRTLEIKEIGGIPRLCLNGKPYFFHGLLDQGYFSDGIFLPAAPEGYERDILTAKRLGFNMLRKHIKVEPEQFYYDCDRLGMVVFQDMVNNGGYSFLRDTALPTVGLCRRDDRRMHRRRKAREAFLASMEQTIRRLSFHPSVCYWTIFNEGWGQFDHGAVYVCLKELDDSRWIDSVSGWFLPPRGRETVSDVESVHVYFKPVCLQRGSKPTVLSEFGGYAHKVAEHSFNPTGNYGYRFFAEKEALEEALERLYLDQIVPAIGEGLCAAVYTQLTDVEDETNGLLTYDRRVTKVTEERMTRIAQALQAAWKQI